MSSGAPVSRTPDARLAFQQVRYQNKIFWRTPVAAFFTLVFPLMFLLVFTTIFGNEEIDFLGVTTAQFYAPALAVFGAATATYTNLAVATSIARDEGILKRIRGTPLPPWIYMTGRIGSSLWTALLAMVLLMTVGVVFYGVRIIGETLAAAVLTFVVGVACFAALGLLVAALLPSGDAAPAVTNATLLPLAFASDVFIPLEDPAAWLTLVGDIFPLKHFVRAFGDAFNPTLQGSGFTWNAAEGEYAMLAHLTVMAAWGLGAVILAVRYFRWEPQGGERPVRKLRRQRQATTTRGGSA